MSNSLIEKATPFSSFGALDFSEIPNVSDEDYLCFLREFNGGYFFNKALVIFGTGRAIEPNFNIIEANALVYSAFPKLKDVATCFAADVFGNPFCFYQGNIVHINIENGYFDVIADSFKDWVDCVVEQSNSHTGHILLAEWENINGKLPDSCRLWPILPFVLGADYTVENLRALGYQSVLNYYADFQKQLGDTPDGTSIDIVAVD